MAGNLMEQMNAELKNFLQEEHRAVPKLLAKMEQSTNVKRENIVYGMASVIAAYLVLGHGAELLCNAIGFAYPAYASFEAIETENKDDDTQWLTYWTVFGTTSLIDFASDKIIGIFPIYWLVKCVFLLWLYVPFFRGAERLHRTMFGPAFKRLRPILKGAESEVQQAAIGAVVQQQQQEQPAVDQAPVPDQPVDQPAAEAVPVQ